VQAITGWTQNNVDLAHKGAILLPSMMKALIILFLILLLPQIIVCQLSKNLPGKEKLLGNVRSVEIHRTYLVASGKSVRQESELIGKDFYDNEHRIIQRSVYGNGEERTTFEWQPGNNGFISKVTYYDLDGTENPTLKSNFLGKTAEPVQSDLCSTFQTRKELGPSDNILIEREICADGTARRVITTEYNRFGLLYRYFVEDRAPRSWEFINQFDSAGAFKGFFYKATDLKNRPYCQDIRYFTVNRDEEGNSRKSVVSAVPCSDQRRLDYQYVEEREISYYVD
jgi:hypothetical protein